MSDNRITAAAAAIALGLTQRRKRFGPCPACRADSDGSRRGPLYTRGPSWFCTRCGVRGDAVNLVSYALTGEPKRYREAFRWLEDRSGAPKIDAHVEPARKRIPLDELQDLLRACERCAGSWTEDYRAHCARKGVDPMSAPGGLLPRPGHPVYRRTRSWWPSRWSSTWRIVLPMFDAHGRLAGMHVRATAPDASPKARWPRGVCCSGLFFADAAGRRLLRGHRASKHVLIVEGFSDFFAMAAKPPSPDRAILGIESGSADRLRLVSFDRDAEVYCATHPDAAGDAYADRIAAAVSPVPVFRLPMMGAL